MVNKKYLKKNLVLNYIFSLNKPEGVRKRGRKLE